MATLKPYSRCKAREATYLRRNPDGSGMKKKNNTKRKKKERKKVYWTNSNNPQRQNKRAAKQGWRKANGGMLGTYKGATRHVYNEKGTKRSFKEMREQLLYSTKCRRRNVQKEPACISIHVYE